jgi:hypothetical protein
MKQRLQIAAAAGAMLAITCCGQAAIAQKSGYGHHQPFSLLSLNARIHQRQVNLDCRGFLVHDRNSWLGEANMSPMRLAPLGRSHR